MCIFVRIVTFGLKQNVLMKLAHIVKIDLKNHLWYNLSDRCAIGVWPLPNGPVVFICFAITLCLPVWSESAQVLLTAHRGISRKTVGCLAPGSYEARHFIRRDSNA